MSNKTPGDPSRRGKARKPSARRVPRAARGTFGDLCEMTDGLAVVWRRNGCTEREMWAFAGDAPSILRDVVPALHSLGFGEEDVVLHVPHDGPLACLLLGLSRLMTARFSPRGGAFGDDSGVLALPPLVALAFLRRALSRRLSRHSSADAVLFSPEIW